MTGSSNELLTRAAEQIERVVERQATMEQELDATRANLLSTEQKLAKIELSGAGIRGAGGSSLDFADPEEATMLVDAVRAGRINEARIPLARSIVGDGGSSEDDDFPVAPDRRPGIYSDARRRLRLAQLLPKIRVNSNSFQFVKVAPGATNEAAEQEQEGDKKAEGNMPTFLDSANIATIAVTIPASEQVLADVPELLQFIQDRLAFQVAEKLDRALAAGTGTIQGLVTEADSFTPTAVDPADMIGEAATMLDILGWTATAVVLHPNDWQQIRSERSASEGLYVAGPWSSPAAPNIWGIPVVTSSAVSEGTALVLDSSQAAYLDRHQPIIAIGRVNEQFAENMVTIRAEVRAGLAVFSPDAVLKVDLTPVSS